MANSKQIDRNIRADITQWVGSLLVLFLTALDVLAWYQLGGDSPLMRALFVGLALGMAAGTVILLWLKQVSYEEDGENMLYIRLVSWVIGGLMFFSITLFMFGHFNGFLKQERDTSQTAQNAEQAYSNETQAIAQARQDIKYAQSTMESAQSNLEQAIAAKSDLMEAHRAENQAIIAKYEVALSNFWQTKDQTGVTYGQIMDGVCTPKRSPYGGGLMKSAAKRLCPDLKKLEAKYAPASPALDDINKQIATYQNQVASYESWKILDEREKKANELYDSKYSTSENSSVKIALFSFLAKKIGTDTETAMAVFVVLTIFILRIAAMMMLGYSSKIRSIPVYNNSGERFKTKKEGDSSSWWKSLKQKFSWGTDSYKPEKTSEKPEKVQQKKNVNTQATRKAGNAHSQSVPAYSGTVPATAYYGNGHSVDVPNYSVPITVQTNQDSQPQKPKQRGIGFHADGFSVENTEKPQGILNNNDGNAHSQSVPEIKMSPEVAKHFDRMIEILESGEVDRPTVGNVRKVMGIKHQHVSNMMKIVAQMRTDLIFHNGTTYEYV